MIEQSPPPVEALLSQMEAHERSEAELLETYRVAAHFSPDGGVGFLMGLILEDEERHHRLLGVMVHTLRQSAGQEQGNGVVPPIDAAPEAQAKLLEQADSFRKIEEEGLRDLEDLQRAVKRLHRSPLDLIVATMVADTKKHLDILRYITKSIGAGDAPLLWRIFCP
ncbi:MAG: hypothetical protein ACYDAG_00265 [Chloroflexota bacterium]